MFQSVTLRDISGLMQSTGQFENNYNNYGL